MMFAKKRDFTPLYHSEKQSVNLRVVYPNEDPGVLGIG